MGSYRVSVDVGGTFTDLVALNEDSGQLINIKVPTTPKVPAVGVVEALGEFLRSHSTASVSIVVHATTIGTNALMGQLGLELPKTALVTTEGFRDVLEIGRQRRSELYNLFVQRPRVLVPRRWRYGVEERVGPNGEIVKPLNQEDLRRVAQRIEEEGLSSIAMGFLNSYINPRHEDEAKRIIEAACPRVPVTASHEVSPEHREYERISTAVVNACLIPIFSAYISDLIQRLEREGVKAPIYVMRSDGGIATAETVKRTPACVVESGPAAGVIAASFYGRMLGLGKVMSFDMGGTTAKAGLVRDYAPDVVTEYEVGGKVHSGRIVKGSGYPVRFPFIDLSECSAGGGTIARVDAGRALRVGPVSAGADPGPACYGMGGEEPTVTDADLVLGRLNPHYILGGRMRVRHDLSQKAIREKVAAPLGLDVFEAAAGIVGIVNSTMAKILRIVSVERGYDPRGFILMAFGGAGPMHACAMAEDLGIQRVVVPPNSGLFSAMGMLAADLKHHSVHPVMKIVSEVHSSAVEEAYGEMEKEGRVVIVGGSSALLSVFFVREADVRYRGQAYELTIPTLRPFDHTAMKHLVEGFHERHRSVYGYAVEGGIVELVNLRLTSVGVTSKPRLTKMSMVDPDASGAILTTRGVFFEDSAEYMGCPIYDRERLKPGNVVEGPAVIEQYDATTVVYPRWRARVGEYGELTLTRTGV